MFMHICIHLDNDVTSGKSNHPSDLVTRSFFEFFRILIREIPCIYSAMSATIWGLLAPTWAPETPASRSTPLKLHIPA